jgi:hypothetical protein
MEGYTDDTFLSDGSNSTLFSTSKQPGEYIASRLANASLASKQTEVITRTLALISETQKKETKPRKGK